MDILIVQHLQQPSHHLTIVCPPKPTFDIADVSVAFLTSLKQNFMLTHTFQACHFLHMPVSQIKFLYVKRHNSAMIILSRIWQRRLYCVYIWWLEVCGGNSKGILCSVWKLFDHTTYIGVYCCCWLTHIPFVFLKYRAFKLCFCWVHWQCIVNSVFHNSGFLVTNHTCNIRLTHMYHTIIFTCV